MRKLWLAVLFLAPLAAWAGTCGNGYGFSRQIVLRRAVNTDQTNYPYLLLGTYANFATVANGGQVQNTAANSIGRTGPADMVFCDAVAAGNALKYEVVEYSATTGLFEIWVQIPTLHTATQDSIWVFTNNSGVSTSQQDLSMWTDISCEAIWHFPDGTTLDAKDSCPVGNNGTINTVTATAGKTGGAANFDGVLGHNISFGGSTTMVTTTTPFSVSFWGKSLGSSTRTGIILKSNDTTPWLMGLNASNGVIIGNNNTFAKLFAASPIASDVYTFGGVSYNGAGAGTAANFSGVQNNSAISFGTTTLSSLTNQNLIGDTNLAGVTFDGPLNEMRFLNTTRTNDWFLTDFATQGGQGIISPYLTKSGYEIIEPTYSVPTVIQFTTCNDPTAATCTMLPVHAGNMIVVLEGSTVDPCMGGLHVPTDTIGTTYTRAVGVQDTGGSPDIETCAFTGIAPSAGANVVSYPYNSGLAVYEIACSSCAVDTSSTVTPGSGVTPVTLPVVTVAQNNSFMFCIVANNTSGIATSGTLGHLTAIPSARTGTADWSGVSAGAGQNCSFTMSPAGNRSAAVLLVTKGSSPAPPTTVRHAVIRD